MQNNLSDELVKIQIYFEIIGRLGVMRPFFLCDVMTTLFQMPSGNTIVLAGSETNHLDLIH